MERKLHGVYLPEEGHQLTCAEWRHFYAQYLLNGYAFSLELQAQQELAEQTEVWSKTQLKLEAEVASYKKTVNELENALEAFKVKTKIERDTMNNLHMQTIMVRKSGKKSRAKIVG